MDARYFLQERTNFIRFYYNTANPAFRSVQAAIEQKRPPYDQPPYSEDGEPPYLSEWLDAELAGQVLGLSCVSLLSDSLKLYLHTLQHRVIGFQFGASEAKAIKRGFLAAHLAALTTILEVEWTDCPADLDVIEQVVLARNRGAHGDDLTSINVAHDRATLTKHPRPFFIDEIEWPWAGSEPGSLANLIAPSIKISRDKLLAAIEQVEVLADWIEARLDRAHTWRAAERARREGTAR